MVYLYCLFFCEPANFLCFRRKHGSFKKMPAFDAMGNRYLLLHFLIYVFSFFDSCRRQYLPFFVVFTCVSVSTFAGAPLHGIISSNHTRRFETPLYFSPRKCASPFFLFYFRPHRTLVDGPPFSPFGGLAAFAPFSTAQHSEKAFSFAFFFLQYSYIS